MIQDLTIPEALFLLARDDATGKPLGNRNSFIQPAGALAQLIMMGRLALRPGRAGIVEVVDTAPTKNRYLDTILIEVATSNRPRRVQFWISRFYGGRNRIHLIGEELVAKGIVEKISAKQFGIFPVTRWRPIEDSPKSQLVSLLTQTLSDEARQPTELVATIIALANSGHLLKRNFDRALLHTHKLHIKRIVKGDWPASAAVTQAIKTLTTAIATGIAAAAVVGTS